MNTGDGLARGSAAPLADSRRQQEIGTPRFGRPTGDWDLIHGELLTFTDPQRDLPLIDRLEGFRPGGHSIYQRVMVAVLCGRTSISAWTYWMPCPPYAERVASGYARKPIFAALSGRKRLTIGPCLIILEDVLSWGSCAQHPRYRLWRGKKTNRP
jgi:hypothetical protein